MARYPSMSSGNRMTRNEARSGLESLSRSSDPRACPAPTRDEHVATSVCRRDLRAMICTPSPRAASSCFYRAVTSPSYSRPPLADSSAARCRTMRQAPQRSSPHAARARFFVRYVSPPTHLVRYTRHSGNPAGRCKLPAMTKRLNGSCLCGEVIYTVADEFTYALICHCSQCRRATGSAFKPFGGIERAKLEVTGPDPHLRRRDDARRPLQDLRLAALFDRAGRHDGARDLRHAHRSADAAPHAHIHVGSKAPWYEINDGLPQHAAFPPVAPLTFAETAAEPHSPAFPLSPEERVVRALESRTASVMLQSRSPASPDPTRCDARLKKSPP